MLPRFSPLLVSSLLLTLVASAAHAMQYADLTVRYVNKQVITYGDALLRMQLATIEAQRRGKPTPKSAAERLEAMHKALESLTDDLLLAEKARELGIQADRDRIILDVMADSKRSNLPLDLRTQSEMRKQRELETSVERIVGWYVSLAPQPTPMELRQIYDTRTSDFARPAQAQVLQILLRPSSSDERSKLQADRKALLRAAQDAQDAELTALVTQHLHAYLVADVAEQPAILDLLLGDLATHIGKPGLAAGDQALCRQAVSLQQRSETLLDHDGIRRRLESVRLATTGLMGAGLVAQFRELARSISQGPGAAQGGDIGWIEPGSFAPAFDAMVFGDADMTPIRLETVSPVGFHGDIGFLVLVPKRKAAQQLSFDEVSSTIERSLSWQRRDIIKAQAVAILRKQASIRDVVQLNTLR